MRVPRLFTAQNIALNSTLKLDEKSAHYLTKVLRMDEGRELILFNGNGGDYCATLRAVEKKSVLVEIKSFQSEDRESPLNLELAIGISRGERMDWVLQKATELGVTKIQPLITERTEVKVGAERGEKKISHWQQILISACEQSQRNRIPQLQVPQKISDWLPTAQAQLKYVLHHKNSSGFATEKNIQSVLLLIGPEGGLTDGEIAQAEAQGFTPLTLGPRVMRTETAPLAAISIAQSLWGDF